MRATKNQIDDLMNEIRSVAEKGERTLVTTLTKKMAEDLTAYLLEYGVKVRYLHSEIDTLERIQIIRDLRLGEYDVLVGVNLLREGLDLPEVSLVGDPRRRQGGLPARRDQPRPDDRPRRAQRRRAGAHVRRHGDRLDARGDAGDRPAPRDPARLQRGARDHPGDRAQGDLRDVGVPGDGGPGAAPAPSGRSQEATSPEELERTIVSLEEEMLAAADDLRFEEAGRIRDELKELRRDLDGMRAGA